MCSPSLACTIGGIVDDSSSWCSIRPVPMCNALSVTCRTACWLPSMEVSCGATHRAKLIAKRFSCRRHLHLAMDRERFWKRAAEQQASFQLVRLVWLPCSDSGAVITSRSRRPRRRWADNYRIELCLTSGTIFLVPFHRIKISSRKHFNFALI